MRITLFGLIFLVFLTLSTSSFALNSGGVGSAGLPLTGGVNSGNLASSGGSGGGPVDFDLGTIPNNKQINIAPNMAKVTGGEGYVGEGNNVHVDYAYSLSGGSFYSFYAVESTDITAVNGVLTQAHITSAENGNRLMIRNPLDPEETERFYIELDKSQSVDYTNNGTHVTITPPQGKRVTITDSLNNFTIDANSGLAKVTIDKEPITSNNKTFNGERFTIEDSNFTFQTRAERQMVVARSRSSVQANLETGFSYIVLGAKTSQRPGDLFEAHNRTRKEYSYALENTGEKDFEFAFEKAGFPLDMLPTNQSQRNFGYEGKDKLTLIGIIEYRRLQSFNQLKSLFNNYLEYRNSSLEFKTVYSSRMMGNQVALLPLGERYNTNQKLDENASRTNNTIVAVQNAGHHRIELATASPVAYYYLMNEEDCPDYLLRASVLEPSANTNGEVRYENGTLSYKNLKVYSKNTAERDAFLNKLRTMINTNKPDNKKGVKLG